MIVHCLDEKNTQRDHFFHKFVVVRRLLTACLEECKIFSRDYKFIRTNTLYISIRREPVKKKQKNREATISTIDFFHRRSKDVDTENIYCKQILTFMDS